jgi:hypothetical protein
MDYAISAFDSAKIADILYLRGMKPTTTYPLLTSRFDLGLICRLDVKQTYHKGMIHVVVKN